MPSATFRIAVAALVPALLLALLLLRPVFDTDIFWQLKLGELILAARHPIAAEPFAATHLGEPLAAVAWLGQAIMAAVRLALGWTGLRVFDALVWLGGFLAAGAAARRRGADPLAIAIALALGFALALPAASIRPQSFAGLSFGLLLLLLHTPGSLTRKAIVGAILLVAWQNLHPSVSLAVVVLAATAAAGWIGVRLRWWSFAARPAALLAAIAAAAMFATPDGGSIMAISARNAAASVANGASEWFPVWAAVNRGFLPGFGAIALLAIVLIWRGRTRIGPLDIIPALILLVLSAGAVRFVFFLGIALIPPLALALMPAGERTRFSPRKALLTVAALAFAGALSVAARPTQFAESIPRQCLEALKATGVSGTIYTTAAWGGPAIDAGFPAWHVAYDGRYYRYSSTEWARYHAASAGEVRLDWLDRTYRPAAFALDPAQDGGLIALLRASRAGWRELRATQSCSAFMRG
jgi:hypothetical protein